MRLDAVAPWVQAHFVRAQFLLPLLYCTRSFGGSPDKALVRTDTRWSFIACGHKLKAACCLPHSHLYSSALGLCGSPLKWMWRNNINTECRMADSQVICSLAGRFLGTYGSPFTAYIHRLRGYHFKELVPDKVINTCCLFANICQSLN